MLALILLTVKAPDPLCKRPAATSHPTRNVERIFQKKYERLWSLLEILPEPVDSIADIGCDHGMLGLVSILTGRAHKAIGIDISEKGLSRAFEKLSTHPARASCDDFWPTLKLKLGDRMRTTSGASEKVLELRHGDGALALRANEVRRGVIVVAGISVPLMLGGFLEGCVESGAEQLILQPIDCNFWNLRDLRSALRSAGWLIEDETITCSGRRYTVTLRACPQEGVPVVAPTWSSHSRRHGNSVDLDREDFIPHALLSKAASDPLALATLLGYLSSERSRLLLAGKKTHMAPEKSALCSLHADYIAEMQKKLVSDERVRSE